MGLAGKSSARWNGIKITRRHRDRSTESEHTEIFVGGMAVLQPSPSTWVASRTLGATPARLDSFGLLPGVHANDALLQKKIARPLDDKLKAFLHDADAPLISSGLQTIY